MGSSNAMNMFLKRKLKYLLDIKDNIFSGRKYQFSYITESEDWVIKQIGIYITQNLNKLDLLKARITTNCFGLQDQIVHFGSVNSFLRKSTFHKPHISNKTVLTWFHFVPDDKRNKNIIEAQKYLDFIHTSCNITKNNLVDLGVNPEKIVVIPLGIDLSLFKPASLKEKQKIKKQLGIPSDRIIIGSFQKDGVGWGEGLKPKLIKGPDIFVEVAGKLAQDYPIFILLVGPARGYVKQELEKRNIPYRNIGYLKNFKEIAKYYQALDLYLITSKIEGGPKQILETIASGIPTVSTTVGMIPDIIENGKEALLAEVEDTEGLAKKAERVIKDKNLARNLIENGLSMVQNYSWDKITQRYYNEIYSKL
jgi:glycosyltransferase involved in cell wall biosynthesis